MLYKEGNRVWLGWPWCPLSLFSVGKGQEGGRVAFRALILSKAILKQTKNQASNRENGEDVRGRRVGE